MGVFPAVSRKLPTHGNLSVRLAPAVPARIRQSLLGNAGDGVFQDSITNGPVSESVLFDKAV